LFPGLDIATRKRILLSRHFLAGDVLTLDAGSGNGALSLAAYRRGNRVMGINIDGDQVRRAEEYCDFLGVDPVRCRFLFHNIYAVAALGLRFDQIICFETLEHLQRDQEVLKEFARVLRPGGVLHLCTPRLDREPYFGERISNIEDGGHVRLGYTFEIFADMLTRAGFEVVATERIVGPLTYWIGNTARRVAGGLLRHAPAIVREAASGGFILVLLPVSWLDRFLTLRWHLCVYVRARRGSDPELGPNAAH
jgi:SAM-dependent methyltransferase